MRGTSGGAGKQDGFTIIELMITVLILGVLVTIVVMTMAISKATAQKAACKANLRTIDSAVQQYVASHADADTSGQDIPYPPDLDTLLNEKYIKGSFEWMCPSGQYDYRVYYDPKTGQTSCPRPDHNP